MAEEANVKVRLDTKQAKSELRGLNKLASGTAGHVGGAVRGVLGPLSLGAIGGAAAGALKAPTAGGIGDLIGGAFGPAATNFEEFFLGKANLEAGAARVARQDLPFRLEGSSKNRKAVRDAALPGFLIRKARELERLQGARGFGQDPRFAGPGAETISGSSPGPSASGLMGAIRQEPLQVLGAIWKNVGDRIVEALRTERRERGVPGGGKK